MLANGALSIELLTGRRWRASGGNCQIRVDSERSCGRPHRKILLDCLVERLAPDEPLPRPALEQLADWVLGQAVDEDHALRKCAIWPAQCLMTDSSSSFSPALTTTIALTARSSAGRAGRPRQTRAPRGCGKPAPRPRGSRHSRHRS